jgi:hypothetical protein
MGTRDRPTRYAFLDTDGIASTQKKIISAFHDFSTLSSRILAHEGVDWIL